MTLKQRSRGRGTGTKLGLQLTQRLPHSLIPTESQPTNQCSKIWTLLPQYLLVAVSGHTMLEILGSDELHSIVLILLPSHEHRTLVFEFGPGPLAAAHMRHPMLLRVSGIICPRASSARIVRHTGFLFDLMNIRALLPLCVLSPMSASI